MKKPDLPLLPADDAPFVLRPYLKMDLARLYSPGLADRSAMNRLNRWIRHNRDLHVRLYSGREGKNDVCFSLRQVRLLVAYLGEP